MDLRRRHPRRGMGAGGVRELARWPTCGAIARRHERTSKSAHPGEQDNDPLVGGVGGRWIDGLQPLNLESRYGV